MTCYCSYLTAYDTSSGESFKLKCRSYHCLEHGAYNRGRLRRALLEYLEKWEMIRFWTFTLSNKNYKNPIDHAADLSKIWRYFMTELRRSKLLRESEKKVQYIRFSEPHQSGYFHFHAVFDRYIHHNKIYGLWIHAVETVTGFIGQSGGCHVKGLSNAKNAAFYIVKYVTKSSAIKSKNMKLWTKSARVSLFPSYISNRTFAIYNSKTGEWIGVFPFLPLLESNITQLHNLSEQLCLFEIIPEPNHSDYYGNY